jgi:hypothetical protein
MYCQHAIVYELSIDIYSPFAVHLTFLATRSHADVGLVSTIRFAGLTVGEGNDVNGQAISSGNCERSALSAC